MSATDYRARVATLGAAGLAAFVGAEHLWPRINHRVPTRFTPDDCRGPGNGELVLGFHGMQGDARQLAPLQPAFDGIGRTLIAESGSDVRLTARDALLELHRQRLTGHTFTIVGVSLGGILAVEALRALGSSVSGIVLISAPATKRAPIWPNAAYEQGSRFLRGGLYSYLVWHHMNTQALHTAEQLCRTDLEAGLAAKAEVRRTMRIPSSNIASSGCLLRKGPRLRRDEFDIPCLVFERIGDNRVRWCFEDWLRAFPRAVRVEIPVPGHATLGDCPQLYIDAITDWRRRNGLDRRTHQAA